MRAEARAAGSPRPDRGLSVATHLAPSVLPAYAFAARRIGERLGRPSELVVAADYRRCAADADDVCFVCSIPFLLLHDAGRIGMEALAAPVLRGERYVGRPVYDSEVIVRADAPARGFDDLTGGRWAYNEPFSHSGFVVALHHLATTGHDASFIGEWIEAGFHDDSIELVLTGRADWAAIDSQVLGLWRRWRPSLAAELRTLAVLGPSTIQPVVASTTRLSSPERAEVTSALLALHTDPIGGQILAACGIERFVAIDGAAYADVREMLSVVAKAGLLPAWWAARWEQVVGEPVSPRSLETARGPRSTGSAGRSDPRPRTSSPRPSPPRS